MTDDELPLIAVFSGPTATIQNTAPLVNAGDRPGSPPPVRAQRLAAPVTVYVEQFSGHPLEADAADLYGPPDGWVDATGAFHAANGSAPPDAGRPVYRVELRPEDGPLLLPYVATTRDGDPWSGTGLSSLAGEDEQRQTFFPDASRLYEEIDTFGFDHRGHGQLLSRTARFEFHRAAPSGGYRKQGELRGEDYWFYAPPHLSREPRPAALVRATNLLQDLLGSGRYLGGQWLEGSPTTEESLYWFNLLLDISVPLVGHSAQRPHGTVSADGDKNIVDGARYIASQAWADGEGRDRVGAVMIVDEVVYAAREVAKTDARPGNYIAAGGHGGVVGTASGDLPPRLTYLPDRKHTYRSDLRCTQLPATVDGADGSAVTIKDASGRFAPATFPAVRIMKFGRYADECCGTSEVDAWLDHARLLHPLAGVVGEGKSPYGSMDTAHESGLRKAVFAGYPVVKVGRGNTGGFTYPTPPWFVNGSNLTATKARILLMAALCKFGALPVAADPADPSPGEIAATAAAVARYQAVFDTH
jgi:L-asparaginase